MHSFGILAAILLVSVALTNALQCRPLTCMIHCAYGFEVDAQGCAICSCRRPAVDLLQTTTKPHPSTTTKHKTSTTTKPKTSTTTKPKTTKTTHRALNAMSSTATARNWLRKLVA